MIKILIADDHYLIREGFQRLIQREVDMTVVGEAESAAAAIEFFKHNECDVVVLDINLPDRTGLDVLSDLRRENPQTKILILSIHPEERFAMRALKSGASGYVTKEGAPEELINAIRKVHHGGRYISNSLAEHFAVELFDDGKKQPHDKLSQREFQVFQMIGAGKSMNEVSTLLAIGLSTVNTYRARVLEKMGMKSNAEIIHYAVKNGLVD